MPFKKKKLFMLFLMVWFALTLTSQENNPLEPITQELYHEIQQAAANDFLRINIRLKDQYDIEPVLNIRHSFSR